MSSAIRVDRYDLVMLQDDDAFVGLCNEIARQLVGHLREYRGYAR